MLLMVEKGFKRAIGHSFYRYAKTNITKTWNIMIEIKGRHIFNIGMKTIYMDGKCCKKFQ